MAGINYIREEEGRRHLKIKESLTVYSEHCPYCDSENITMIGDPEYNDNWVCVDCEKQFGTFKTKVVKGSK